MDDHLKQLLLLGREHYQKRELDKAESVLLLVVAEADGFPDVFDMLGVIAHTRGDYALAEQHFERAVELNGNYTEAQLNLMVTYNDLGKYDQARAVYETIRGRRKAAPTPDPFAAGRIANMHAEVSQAYVDAGMLSDAILELERAIALCPEFVDLRTRLGMLHRDTGSVERAKEHLNAAIAHNGQYAPARVTLGVLLLSEGDHAQAIREFEAALVADGEHRSAQMYLRLARAQRDELQRSP